MEYNLETLTCTKKEKERIKKLIEIFSNQKSDGEIKELIRLLFIHKIKDKPDYISADWFSEEEYNGIIGNEVQQLSNCLKEMNLRVKEVNSLLQKFDEITKQ